MKILEAFKEGTKDSAKFWINFGGRVIHIRYFALRDKERNYKGVMNNSRYYRYPKIKWRETTTKVAINFYMSLYHILYKGGGYEVKRGDKKEIGTKNKQKEKK